MRRMLVRRTSSAVALLGLVAFGSAVPAAADTTPSGLPFAQGWSDASLITTTNDWSGVPSVIGYTGAGLVSGTDADPRTLLADGASTPVSVVAQSSATSTAGGVHEVTAAQTVALQGSGSANAPQLVIRLDSTGASGLTVAYTLRDLDADNGGAQQVALQYRVGGSGPYTDVPAGYVADASGTLGDRFPVSAVLPAAADNQPVLDVRILTTDTTGSDSMTGVDDISVVAGSTGGPASPVATCQPSLTTVVGTAATAHLSAVDADSGIASASITSAAADGISLTGATTPSASGQPASVDLSVSATTVPGTYPVTVEFATADSPAQSVSCTVQVVVEAPAVLRPISVVQGSGAASPFVGQDVVVEGVVTSLFERSDVLDAFFLQTPDAAIDGDPATSEGIYVFCRGVCPAVSAGDVVRASGEVSEYFGMTQVSVQGGSAVVLSSGAPLPTPTPVALPAASATDAEATFEPVEGMLVRFPSTLSVSEYFELARFGTVELTAGGRPHQFTHVSTPSVAGNAAYLADLATRRIILDDDNNDNNDAITGPDADEPYAYPSGGLSTTNRLRGGDTITGLTGVMHWSFSGATATDAWRIRPVAGVDYSFSSTNPRTAAPDAVGGRLQVASFNVLNYFTTIDTTASSSTGPCGPVGGLDCRGADSVAELDRQRAKTVAAITAINPDVAGLLEIQNDAGASVDDLLAALNAKLGAGTYAKIDTGTIGGDAIKVALIFKPAVVDPVGAYAILDSSVDPRFIDTRNRPALIQTFEERSSGERFTIAVNHLKSKGSSCAGDPDLGDGQGNCPKTRQQAAQALADYLATDPTHSGDPDFLVVGDLNSYRREDSIRTLEARGYTDLVEQFPGDEAYSYLFDGQLGYLDHALANGALRGQVTGVTERHINSDESPLYDYNDSVYDSPGEATFDRESGARDLYAADPYRASDHDPVVIGLALDSNLLTCDGRTATILGTPGNDTVYGTTGEDVIVTLGGSDVIDAKGGDDLICAGSGHDTVRAGTGDDVVYGGLGNDTLDGESGDDVDYGGNGNDSVKGGNGADRLFGDDGDDSVAGENGNDRLEGGDGADTLSGGNGADVLIGGAGTDVLDGGNGADTETP